MVLKIVCFVILILCALCSFSFKKLAPVVLKRTPDENEVLKFKIIMLFVITVCALAIILPDYI